MRPRLVPVLVLVVATLALVASVALVTTRGESWMAGGFAPGMMGYASSGGGEPVRDIGAARRQESLPSQVPVGCWDGTPR